MKTLKRTVAAILAVILLTAAAGCSKGSTGGKNGDNGGKVTISVGNWEPETSPVREDVDKAWHKFMDENPDIIVEPDTYVYDAQTFIMKAAANQLPTLYTTHFTEIDKIRNAGYSSDVTEALRKHGFMETMNPDLLELVTDENGRAFAIPYNAYAMGLYIYKPLFREAGLVNADGSIMVPDTYEQLAEYAQIIKEKTGKAGYIFPTVNNCGGWHLLNIAWSFGTEFVEQQPNGKWKAAFDTPNFRKALQYVYDLKWKYNVLPDNTLIDISESKKLFGTGQGAMLFSTPPGSEFPIQYGTKIDDLMLVRMPAGDHGRFAQIGGAVYMIAPNASPEQIDACFIWLEKYQGLTPKITDNMPQQMSDSFRHAMELGHIVLGREAFELWVNPERMQIMEDAAKPYINVDLADYNDYFSFKDVTLKPEPPVAAQELYSVLDKAVQEVTTNKNADIDAITKTILNDFQINHLDKLD